MDAFKKKILLVEDEALIAILEKQDLEKYGYSVTHVMNGEEAIHQTLNNDKSFDVILMDINLGAGIDGTQAAKEILKANDIPIVFVSSHTEPEIVEKTETITSYGYVVKNSGIVILDASIKMALKLFNEKKARRDGNERLRFTLECCHIGTWDLNLADNTAVRSIEHARIFGYEQIPPIWSRETFLEHILPEDREPASETIQRAIQTQGNFSFACRIRRVDGQVRWIWVAGRSRVDADGKGHHLSGVVQDITERKVHEAEIERLSRLYAALSQINQAIVRVNSLEGLIREITRVAIEFGGFNIAWVGRYNPKTREVTPLGWAGKQWEAIRNFRHSLADDAESRCLCVPVIREKCFCVVNDLSASPEMQGWLSALFHTGIRSAAVFPIRVQGVIWGVFGIYDNKPNVFHDSDIALLEEAAVDIGYAIEHINNEAQRRQAEQLQRLSTSILAILNEPLTLREISSAILGVIKKETGLDAVGIRLKDGDDFPYFSDEGLSKEFLLAENSLILRSEIGAVCRDDNGQPCLQCTCGMVLAEKCGPPSDYVTAAGSIWTNDSLTLVESLNGQDPRLKPRNRCIHEGFLSVALIPIRVGQQVIGLLHLNDRRRDCFTPEIIHYFEGLTAIFGIAVDRKQTEEEITRQLAEKEILLLEVHHRIKKNMTNFEALLLLQTNSTDNTEVKAALGESIDRLHSVRILYDKMLLLKDYQDVSIKSYVAGLIDSIISIYVIEKIITMKTEITDFTLVSKKAIAIGIVINELLTNALKYAFTDRQHGIVSISINKVENNVILVIKDNGIGIDDRIYTNKSAGFGLIIVKMLVEQLKGTYNVLNENGTKSIIKFEI